MSSRSYFEEKYQLPSPSAPASSSPQPDADDQLISDLATAAAAAAAEAKGAAGGDAAAQTEAATAAYLEVISQLQPNRELPPINPRLTRSLPAADIQLLHQLQDGRPVRHQQVIELAFQNASILAAFKDLQAERQAELVAQKLEAAKARRAARMAEGGNRARSESAVANDAEQQRADDQMASLLQNQDPAITNSAAAAAAAAAQAAAQAGASEADQSEAAAKAFADMLIKATEAEAARDIAKARQASTAEQDMLRKMQQGKTTKQGKLIQQALKNAGIVEEFTKTQQNQQDNAFLAKLAAGKQARKKAPPTPAAVALPAPVEEEKYQAAPVTQESVMAILQSKLGSDKAASVAQSSQQDAVIQEVAAAAATAAAEAAHQAGLSEAAAAQAAAKAFADMLMQATEAEAARDMALSRQLNAADNQLMAKLMKGKTTKQQKLIEKAFQDEKVVDAIRANQADKQEEAMRLKLMAGKKKRAAAPEIPQTDQSAAGLTQESINSIAGSLGLSAEELGVALALVNDTVNENPALFMKNLIVVGQSPAAAQHQLLQTPFTDSEAALITKFSEGRPVKQKKLIELAFHNPAIPQAIKALEAAKYERKGPKKPVDAAAVAAAEAIAAEVLGSDSEEEEQETGYSTEFDNYIVVSIAAVANGYDELEDEFLEYLSDKQFITRVLTSAAEVDTEDGPPNDNPHWAALLQRITEIELTKDNNNKNNIIYTDPETTLLKAVESRHKSYRQGRLLELCWTNHELLQAIKNLDSDRAFVKLNANTEQLKAATKVSKKKQKAAEEAFLRLRKIFLGAIKRLPETSIIRNLEDCKELFSLGYLDINKPVKDSGEAFLHIAAKYGKFEVCEWLLLNGANPNAVTTTGQSALHIAAANLDPNSENHQAAQAAPAIPNALNEKEMAIRIARSLVGTSGDLRLPDSRGETPITISQRFGFDFTQLGEEPCALFAGAARRAAAKRARLKALQEAAKAKAAAAAAAVLSSPAGSPKVELTEEEMEAQLNEALAAQQAAADQLSKAAAEPTEDEPILEILAAPSGPTTDPAKIKRANMVYIQLSQLFSDIDNPRNEQEAMTLLKNNLDLIKEGYLDLSRPVKGKVDGSTFLHEAVYAQKLTLVRTLLNGRANPNKQTMTGETSLHVAVLRCETSPHGRAIINLLLEAGADPNLRDFRNGKNAYDSCASEDLRQWMKAWRPQAERSQQSIADQFAALDRMDSAINKSKQSSEDAFLAKLLNGKLTKQKKLLEEALKNNDQLRAKQLTDEQRQLEAMAARLAKGKAKRSAAATPAAGSGMSEEEKRLMEELLLGEISEATKNKILAVAAAYAESPNALQGLDLNILNKLRNLPIADAIQLLSMETNANEQQQSMVNNIAKNPNLPASEKEEFGRQSQILDVNGAIYKDLMENMVKIEKQKRLELTSDEEQAAERLRLKMAKKANKTGPIIDLEFLQAIFQVCAEYIYKCANVWIEPAALLNREVPLDELTAYGLDTELFDRALSLGQDQFVAWLQERNTHNEETFAHYEKLLAAPQNLSPDQLEECQRLLFITDTNSQLYHEIFTILHVHTEAPPAPVSVEEQQLAADRLAAKLAAKAAREQQPEETQAVDGDTGLSTQTQMNDAALDVLRALTAEHLNRSVEELKDMSSDQLQMELVKKGVDIDIFEQLKRLSEAEAGKYLARQVAQNDAEADMLRRLLRGKGLTQKQRDELAAREKLLDDASKLYNDMLASLTSGSQKKYDAMTKEERLAHEKMLAKLAARQAKKEQEELLAKQQRAAAEAEKAATEAAMEALRRGEDPEAAALAAVQAPTVHKLLGDSEAFDVLADLVSSHLGLSKEELKTMSFDQTQAELAAKGVDIDILDMLRKLTEQEAAKYLHKQLARDDAEARMLRKLLQGKGLTQKQREELEARERMLQKNAELYEKMMKELLDGEKNRYDFMSKEEKAAHDRMMAKLEARRRAQKKGEAAAAGEAEQDGDQPSPEPVEHHAAGGAFDENHEFYRLFDDLVKLGHWECSLCLERNRRDASECGLCKSAPPAGGLAVLDLNALWEAHQFLHGCQCRFALVEGVARSLGPCVKKNFLEFMESLTLACHRDEQVYWDFKLLDTEGEGSIGQPESELLWAFNCFDVPQPRWSSFKTRFENAANQFTLDDFRQELIRTPQVHDYL